MHQLYYLPLFHFFVSGGSPVSAVGPCFASTRRPRTCAASPIHARPTPPGARRPRAPSPVYDTSARRCSADIARPFDPSFISAATTAEWKARVEKAALATVSGLSSFARRSASRCRPYDGGSEGLHRYASRSRRRTAIAC